MQDDGAEAGAAHPRVRDADRVRDAALQERARQHEIPDLRHARVALRTRPAHNQDGGFVRPELRLPSSLMVFLDGIEHESLAAVPHRVRRIGRLLDHGALPPEALTSELGSGRSVNDHRRSHRKPGSPDR